MEWQSQKLNCFSKLQISTFSESYYGRWKNTNGAHRSSGKLIFIFRGAREAGADGSWVAPLTSAVRQQVNKLQYGPSLTSRLKHCRGKKTVHQSSTTLLQWRREFRRSLSDRAVNHTYSFSLQVPENRWCISAPKPSRRQHSMSSSKLTKTQKHYLRFWRVVLNCSLLHI